MVAFLIFPTQTNNFNVDSLKGQAVTKQLRYCSATIEWQKCDEIFSKAKKYDEIFRTVKDIFHSVNWVKDIFHSVKESEIESVKIYFYPRAILLPPQPVINSVLEYARSQVGNRNSKDYDLLNNVRLRGTDAEYNRHHVYHQISSEIWYINTTVYICIRSQDMMVW